MDERGAVQESRDLFRFVREAVKPLVVGRALLGAVFGNEIGQACTRDGSFEARGLSNGPFGHVAAIRPAANGQLFGISDAPRNEVVNARHNVPVIASTPVSAIHLNEFLAITARSANVGIKNRVAARR